MSSQMTSSFVEPTWRKASSATGCLKQILKRQGPSILWKVSIYIERERTCPD